MEVDKSLLGARGTPKNQKHDPFDAKASVQDIFGDISGSLLQDAIFQTYQVGQKLRIPFFLDTTSIDHENFPYASRQPGIVRHTHNQRKRAGVKRAYIKSCQARGIVDGVRGECWCGEPLPDQFGHRGNGPFQALSYGSLCESFYAALQLDPTNPLLQRTLQRGLEVRVFSNKMPDSIAKYLVRLHNRFHGGAGVSFVELMQTVPDVLAMVEIWQTFFTVKYI